MEKIRHEDMLSAFSPEDAETFVCTVTEAEDGRRADAALACLCELSRSAITRLTEEGRVLRRGTAIDKKTVLHAGDTVEIRLPPPAPCEAEPEDIPLDVVYEDADVIVVNKPKGMVVHPAPGHERGTLVSALLWRCGDSLSGIGGVARPGIVHRIDRDTTGLIAAAKNDAAHLALAAQLSDHTMHREYEALLIGRIDAPGVVDAPIGRHPRDRKRMAVVPASTPGARHAVTHYESITTWGAFSHVKLRLETGRTHQIRVHMSHIGHPLMGDEIYGGGRTPFERHHAPLICGQCLHARSLTFLHPRTGEPLTLSAPPPPEFSRLLEILGQGET